MSDVTTGTWSDKLSDGTIGTWSDKLNDVTTGTWSGKLSKVMLGTCSDKLSDMEGCCWAGLGGRRGGGEAGPDGDAAAGRLVHQGAIQRLLQRPALRHQHPSPGQQTSLWPVARVFLVVHCMHTCVCWYVRGCVCTYSGECVCLPVIPGVSLFLVKTGCLSSSSELPHALAVYLYPVNYHVLWLFIFTLWITTCFGCLSSPVNYHVLLVLHISWICFGFSFAVQ